MPIIKHARKNGYVQISNSLAQSRKLSFEARGVLIELLSRPDNWILRKTQLQFEKCGIVMLTRIFKELREAGYLKIEYERADNRIKNQYWIVSDEPMLSTENEALSLQNIDNSLHCFKDTLFQGNQLLQIQTNTNTSSSIDNSNNKHINTNINNNKNNNTKKYMANMDGSVCSDKFELQQKAQLLFNSYPPRPDCNKNQSLKNIVNLLNKGIAIETLMQAVDNYKKYIGIRNVEQMYWIKASNFFGQHREYEQFVNFNFAGLKIPEKKEEQSQLSKEADKVLDMFRGALRADNM